MPISIIHNRAEFEAFYHYAPKYQPKAYPVVYPCVVKKETEYGGIGGDYVSHSVIYFPTIYEGGEGAQSLQTAFLAGLRAEWQRLC